MSAASLPSLAMAFSRRAAIIGAVAAPMALAGPAAHAVGVPKFWETADTRLTAMAAEVKNDIVINDHENQNARLDRADALMRQMAGMPAAGPAGLLAKAKAWLDSDSYDVQEGSTLAESIAEDIERLHRTGGLGR